MFWVISVYFNLRNILPKSGTFLPGHPVVHRAVCEVLVILVRFTRNLNFVDRIVRPYFTDTNPCRISLGYSPLSHLEGSNSVPVGSTWNFFVEKWHWPVFALLGL